MEEKMGSDLTKQLQNEVFKKNKKSDLSPKYRTRKLRVVG